MKSFGKVLEIFEYPWRRCTTNYKKYFMVNECMSFLAMHFYYDLLSAAAGRGAGGAGSRVG